MAKQIRYGTYADFQPEKMVTAELACVISGDPAVSDGRSLYICFSPGVVKRIATYADFEREIQNATQEIQDAFTEDVQAAIQAAVNAINNANDAITQANEAAEQALSAAADAEEAAEAALAAAGGDISEKTVTFDSQDAEDPEEWTDVDVLATGTKLSLLFQKVSSMFKNIRFLKKKTDVLDLEVNKLNTNKVSYPTSGTFLCFFKAINSRVVLYVFLPVDNGKQYKLGSIKVWASGSEMGTQNTFSLVGKTDSGLCFESTNPDVIYYFGNVMNNDATPGTAYISIS